MTNQLQDLNWDMPAELPPAAIVMLRLSTFVIRDSDFTLTTWNSP
jgi:hypothetical protein